jgi:hypothetical protein
MPARARGGLAAAAAFGQYAAALTPDPGRRSGRTLSAVEGHLQAGAFGKALETLGQLRGEYPNLRLDIKRVIAEGDMVVTHSHLDLEPGKVVEHWDVIQDVPNHAANPNGMF